MFAGIVETTTSLVDHQERDQVLEIHLKRPSNYKDLQVGQSIAVNGVCLTLEDFDSSKMVFVLAAETLQLLQWDAEKLKKVALNLERSLRMGDTVDGHWVTGHVDSLAEIASVQTQGESRWVRILIPERLKPMIWPKGSVTINGVSLTINEVTPAEFSVCLIPETLRRTNLGELKAPGQVCLEVDNMARGLVHNLKLLKDGWDLNL